MPFKSGGGSSGPGGDTSISVDGTTVTGSPVDLYAVWDGIPGYEGMGYHFWKNINLDANPDYDQITIDLSPIPVVNDLIKIQTLTITRTGGYISKVEFGSGGNLTVTRDGSNRISGMKREMADGWGEGPRYSITRDGNGYISFLDTIYESSGGI